MDSGPVQPDLSLPDALGRDCGHRACRCGIGDVAAGSEFVASGTRPDVAGDRAIFALCRGWRFGDSGDRRSAEGSVGLLPGLWSILFSLGVFASRRLLPRAIVGVAWFYLLAGLGCLAMAQGEASLSPWAMGIPFGGGQLLAAAVLYRTLECDHGV